VNPLFLSGFGVSLNVDRARLIVEDGHQSVDSKPFSCEVEPRRAPFDSIVIDSQSGHLSIDAVKWLMRHGIPLFILDYNGSILSSVLPKEPVTGHLKKAQLEAYQDPQRRAYIAKKLVEAKLERARSFVEWLSLRYSIEDKDKKQLDIEINRLGEAKDLKGVLFVEGRTADVYWRIFQKLIPKKCGFLSRMHESHQMNSTDQVNTLLNYGYAFLESRCRAAINTVGLEPSIGFLHEITQPKYPLVYDLQEPFRWIVDLTVLSCLENKIFSKKDFFLTDNYVLRLKPPAIKKLLEQLRLHLNSRVRYKGKNHSWDTILQLKTQELARHLLGRTEGLDFTEPVLESEASPDELRKKVLALTVPEARGIGVNKSTLWYLQKRAAARKTLRSYAKVKSKLRFQSI